MASSVDFSDLPSKLKDYALDENNQILSKVLIDNNNFLDYMGLIPGVNDEYPLTEVEINDVIQPGNKDDFNPTEGAINLKARIAKVRPVKVDLQFKPTQIQGLWKTYIGQIQRRVPGDAYDLPFEAFFMQMIVKKAKENLRKKVLYKGVYNSSGTTPKDCVNGIIKLIDLARTDGSIPGSQVVDLGTISATNAVDKFESLFNILPDDYKDEDMIIVGNPTLIQYYSQDYKTSFGSLPYNLEFKKRMLDLGHVELISEPGLTGSDLLICTKRDNMKWLVDEEAKLDNIIIEKEKRNINVMMDFNCAPDFALASEMFVSDPTVYPS